MSCYTVLSRIIWFAASSQQRTKENLFISPSHITTLVSLYEIVTVAVIVAGNALIVHGITEEFFYGNDTEGLTSGFSVLLAGLILQLCSRLYLLAVVWRVTIVSKDWVVKSTGLRYDTRTMLHVVNLSGMLLTVSACRFRDELDG